MNLSLREPTFLILLSLGPGKRHGYGILKDVQVLSGGKVRLSTGTLYGALGRLLEQGLIERVSDDGAGRVIDSPGDDGTGDGPGRLRKAYRLTPGGRQALETEIERMQALVSAARLRLREDQP
jgi:DNA-binding PadR family transcriptional regulator